MISHRGKDLALIGLERDQIIGAPFEGLAGDRLLAAHRVQGSRRREGGVVKSFAQWGSVEGRELFSMSGRSLLTSGHSGFQVK